MRYVLIAVLIMMTAVLGCTPAPQNDVVSDPDNSANDASAAQENYEQGTWTEDWDLALSAAKALQRPVLVNFTGSDWCSWCMRLSSEVFSKDEFNSYAKENLVLLKLDFPKKIEQSKELKEQNETRGRQFGVEGFPTIILLDSEGKEINRTGYQPGGAAKYIGHLQALLAE